MKKTGLALLVVSVALPTAVQAFAQADGPAGLGRAVLTIVAKHNEVAPALAPQNFSIKVNGKNATVTGLTQFKGNDDSLELVMLIDSAAHNLGSQIDEIERFIQGLGPNTRFALGYMESGRAVLSGPLSIDHQQAASQLHLPSGPSANVYFSLSDLARHWPSQEPKARREVIVVADGIDPNSPTFDANDPYVQAAINDSLRAGLVVYSIFWHGQDRSDPDPNAINGGQSLLGEVAQATGGSSYSSGTGNPVSFRPFFANLMLRLANQYALDFTARLDRKPMVESMKVRVEAPSLQVTAPEQVFVDKPAAAE